MFLKGLKKTAEHFLNHCKTGREKNNNENHKIDKVSTDNSDPVII